MNHVWKLRKFIVTLIWQKYRESTVFTKELIWHKLHTVEKWKIYCQQNFFPSNQLFSNLLSKCVVFTKFLSKLPKFPYFPLCECLSLWGKIFQKIPFLWRLDACPCMNTGILFTSSLIFQSFFPQPNCIWEKFYRRNSEIPKLLLLPILVDISFLPHRNSRHVTFSQILTTTEEIFGDK